MGAEVRPVVEIEWIGDPYRSLGLAKAMLDPGYVLLGRFQWRSFEDLPCVTGAFAVFSQRTQLRHPRHFAYLARTSSGQRSDPQSID